MAKRATLGAVMITAACAWLGAQGPVFEAATIKPNRSGSNSSTVQQRPGGQYVMVNGPISTLLLNAFRPQNTTLVGAPDWVTSDRYDLEARANATTSSDDLRAMLRALLIERLKLSAHLEPREQPVYYLVLARGDGRLGPNIERTTRDCGAVADATRAGRPIPELTPPKNGGDPCGIRSSGGEILAGGLTMDVLARNLGNRAGRVVFDRTGLEGYYDLTVHYSADADRATSDAPAFFTALQEQLGLKLEPGRAPLQTLVIEHIERPDGN